MRSVRDYAVITAAYWVFTLTDGALRMLVLLYLNQRGHAPLEIASLFLFYEFFGIVTNFVGGWLGARFGLRSTLFSGLALQIAACSMLALAPTGLTVLTLMVAQAISGIAKDLTKMSAKSYVKLVVPAGDATGLMRWVAILTGSKNTLKGVGFFLGGLLLATAGFQGACAAMAVALVAALVFCAVVLPRDAGRATSKVRLSAMLSKDARIRWLCVARFFLFGSRDVWFVLALPIFLATDLGWSFSQVGGFLAVWVIGYGVVQASAPAYLRRTDAGAAAFWTALLVAPLGGIVLALYYGASPATTLTLGLAAFGVVFAINSAIHSYLIVAYAAADKVSLAVGLYYMANAAGRLTGTLLSGAIFQAAGRGLDGLIACIATSLALVLASRLACGPLRTAERG